MIRYNEEKYSLKNTTAHPLKQDKIQGKTKIFWMSNGK